MTMHIACTAISKRIQIGRVNKAGNSFIGEPKDVTSDCLKAVIAMIGAGNVTTMTVDGVPAYEIEVRLITKEQP